MKKLIIRCIYFLAIIFTFTKCKEKEPANNLPIDYKTFPLGEAKSYLWALPGSHWIYRNSKTGELDTHQCVAFICDTMKYRGEQKNAHVIVEYEIIYRQITSTYNPSRTYIDETVGYDPNFLRPLKARFYRSSSEGGKIAPFFHPFNFNEHDGTSSTITICQGVDSVFSLLGKTYTNVAKFEIDMDNIVWGGTVENANVVFFWAKEVGLIQRINKTENFRWELIDYKIIK